MDILQKQRVVDLALDLILKMGVKSFRVDELASVAGISKRTLYEAFADKEDIIRQAAMKFFDEEERQHFEVGRACENVVLAMLAVMEHVSIKADVAIRLREQLRQQYHNIFQDVISEVMSRRLQTLGTIFSIGVEQGLIRSDIDLRFALVTLQYLARTLSENGEEIRRECTIDPIAAGRQVMMLYIRGMCTVQGVEIVDDYISKEK